MNLGSRMVSIIKRGNHYVGTIANSGGKSGDNYFLESLVLCDTSDVDENRLSYP